MGTQFVLADIKSYGLTVSLSDRVAMIFPGWNGNLFVAALAEKSVRRLVMSNGTVLSQETMFTELDERIREVREGPDGNLYLLSDSDEGRVLRVSPGK